MSEVVVNSGESTDWATLGTLLRRKQKTGLWRYEIRSGHAFCSKEALQLLGLPAHSSLDLHTLKGRFRRHQRAALERAYRRSLHHGDAFEFVYELHGPDGAEKSLKACGALVEIDGIQQLIGSLADVTEERRAFETVATQASELRDLKELLDAENTRFKELFDQAPVFVALGSTPDLRFEYANRAYRSLVGNRRLVGKTVAEALPEVVAQGLVALLMQVYETGQPYMAEEAPTELYDEQGNSPRQRYLTYIYQPIRGSGGKVTGVLCVGYDVTEQRLAREEAERLRTELNRASYLSAMGTMAATLAHELNQPLTALVMFSAGLARRMGETADAISLQAIEGIQAQALRASEIMRRMKMIATGHAIRYKPIDLRQSFENVLKSSLVACRDVEVDLDFQHAGFVSGDDLQVEQVIINILRNACEAMMGLDAKRVHIVTKNQATEVLVCLTDTGPGIPPDVLPRMFEATQSAKDGGMGIGLAICRTIIEAHGGRIGVDSGRDVGAAIWFTLPRHSA